MITINGKPYDGYEGLTITQLLKAFKYDFPLVFVRLNGRIVLQKDLDTEIVSPGASLEIYPIISGG